jgi:Domain of unknown function (DUF4345)
VTRGSGQVHEPGCTGSTALLVLAPDNQMRRDRAEQLERVAGVRPLLPPQSVTLGSPDATAILRGFGAVFFGLAFTLLACLVAKRRLLAGLAFLVTIATPIAAVRIVGLAIDGLGPFAFKVLPPEILIVVLSTSAFFLERRRREALTDGTIRADATAHARSEDE